MNPPASLLPVIEIFSHCLITLILPNSNFNFISFHPIFVHLKTAHLFQYRTNGSYYWSPFIHENITYRMHRPLCWSTVFPESPLYNGEFPHSRIFPSIWGSPGPVYFIFLANSQQKMEIQLDQLHSVISHTDLNFMGNREFCVFVDTPDANPKFYHLNRYHRLSEIVHPNPVPIQLVHKFPKFTEFHCPRRNLHECYFLLDKRADLISTTFAPYFWIYPNWMDDLRPVYTYRTNFRRIQSKYFFTTKYPDWFSVADDSKNFDDFLAYTIFSETLYNLTIPAEVDVEEKYLYFGSSDFRFERGNHQIIMLARRACSFIACYGVEHEKSYELFTKPFDKVVWILISLVITVFMAMSNFLSGPSNVDMVIVSFSILLEVSLSSLITKVIPRKMRALFWFWILTCVTIICMYKDVFTAEVIKPYRRNPVWSHIYDLEGLGFKFLLPLKAHIDYENAYGQGRQAESIVSIEFAWKFQEAALYEGNLTRLAGYRRIGRALLGGRDLVYSKTHFSKGSQSGRRIWQELHHKWGADLYSNLSRCTRKFAYVDYTENIDAMLPFLNDNGDGIVFMKGADDGFLSTSVGFQVDSTHRKNFVYGRLKGLISSGIYHWWEKWFKKSRPRKLFMYYANWTKPIVNELERRDFRTKFLTTCKIWGYCCVACGLVCMLEIGKSIIEKIIVQKRKKNTLKTAFVH
ncbi:hypothetical protein Fcan01_15456 [Folsomia candida]|uniref:Uncharacterized protein n=1 Tax=Folsomia candida TaxID=158441 RepID=A0A226DXX4_FOLCA|nr:hypothetical protein Fcan01_15456 [Folsomia candida]